MLTKFNMKEIDCIVDYISPVNCAIYENYCILLYAMDI